MFAVSLLCVTLHLPTTRDILASKTTPEGSLLPPRRNFFSFSASFRIPIVGHPTSIVSFENGLTSATVLQAVNSITAMKAKGQNEGFMLAHMDSVNMTLYSVHESRNRTFEQ